MACLCDACRKENWDQCVNTEYVGHWKRVPIQEVGGASDREHSAQRARRADGLADSLTGDDTVVALYTTEGSYGERMWLMKAKGQPWVVPPNTKHKCAVSGEKFGPGERVLKGEYYELVTANVYEFRPDLGVFSVSARMLRAGGPSEPVELEMQPRRRAARNSSRHTNTREFFNLSHSSAARIKDLIENVYKDKEPSQ